MTCFLVLPAITSRDAYISITMKHFSLSRFGIRTSPLWLPITNPGDMSKHSNTSMYKELYGIGPNLGITITKTDYVIDLL